MAAENLDDHKAPNGDVAPAESDQHENQAAKQKSAPEEEEEQQQDSGISDDKDHEVEKSEEETDREEGEEKEKEGEKKPESDPATPASKSSERPTRERKSVERYTVSSPHKFPRSSATKTLSVDKGTGTQLKDIPNVAFKLSKRKADDNLRALHNILFGKKAKARNLKTNIGLFSGFVWTENEEKQRAKVKERIDKCVKEKLLDFCDVLNIQINKSGLKKEEVSARLLEFLESPHVTTDVLLADKEKKGKKRARKSTPSRSSGGASETPSKKQKQTSQAGKKRKQSSDIEEEDTAEPSDATFNSQEDEDVSVPKSESDHEDVESQSEEEEDKQKAHKGSPKSLKENQPAPGRKTSTVKAAKSSEKPAKKSFSKKTDTDSTSASLSKSKQSASKKQKMVSENLDSKRKLANKKQTDKSSKALAKDQGKGNGSEKSKAEPSKEEMHAVVVNMLKEVDFNTATLSDILKQLGTHFGLDLMHRRGEVKGIITDVIKNMSDEEDEGEESEDGGDADTDDDVE